MHGLNSVECSLNIENGPEGPVNPSSEEVNPNSASVLADEKLHHLTSLLGGPYLLSN
jgi:hypothetical protein